MLRIIKGARVFSPEYLGKKDILIANDKIEKIADNIEPPSPDFSEVEVIDAKGKILTPGFIDAHVHLIGGGGEGGFATRTPEAMLSMLTRFGVTTAVGCLGTDGTTRHMTTLLAKARALEEEGITTYIYTGSYEIPARVITDSPRNDIILIDKVIGIGEIAISDHRSSQPVMHDLLRLASEARVGGILSGKAGVLHLHVGDGRRRLDYLFDIIDEGEIPPTQMVPTHVNRSHELFNQAIRYAKMGGVIDLTSSIFPIKENDPEIKASKAIKILLNSGVPDANVTMSSDGFGSSPIFDNKGKLIKLGIGSVKYEYTEFRDAVLKENIPLATALKPLTSNTADILKLNRKKGRIRKGLDADYIIFDEKDLSIDSVVAKGKIMVQNGLPIVFGTFEKS
ncbi:MAG: beta-aspartyl-peptidase [Clostridiales bacterium]|nr:beta-aspartyl-peptidase [Clostridiales bacterium]